MKSSPGFPQSPSRTLKPSHPLTPFHATPLHSHSPTPKGRANSTPKYAKYVCVSNRSASIVLEKSLHSSAVIIWAVEQPHSSVFIHKNSPNAIQQMATCSHWHLGFISNCNLGTEAIFVVQAKNINAIF